MKGKNIYTDEERYWMTGGNTGTLPPRLLFTAWHQTKSLCLEVMR